MTLYIDLLSKMNKIFNESSFSILTTFLHFLFHLKIIIEYEHTSYLQIYLIL